jgi:hypothetical protein
MRDRRAPRQHYLALRRESMDPRRLVGSIGVLVRLLLTGEGCELDVREARATWLRVLAVVK